MRMNPVPTIVLRTEHRLEFLAAREERRALNVLRPGAQIASQRGASLFTEFAPRCLLGGFAFLEIAARESPQAGVIRSAGAPHEQHAPVGRDANYGGCANHLFTF